ncbi:WD40 repeat-like protein [Irpex rosettiformis]|uniref:WD40 repeat-like protein n=1 Tax=Irpex rosettiformis TaxID=378272 RepID=A0ACB8TWM8_9APHY|nr:WD40 repeat-like protein [Irpex rosettiformis]
MIPEWSDLSQLSVQEREDVILRLMLSLPRSSVANIRRKMAPLMKVDIVGLLPDEVSLLIFSCLPWQTLLSCSLVNWRWRALANDPSLWRWLCKVNKWEWRENHNLVVPLHAFGGEYDDEGMGEDEEDVIVEQMLLEDSGFSSMVVDSPSHSRSTGPHLLPLTPHNQASLSMRPLLLSSPSQSPKFDYKLLFRTHVQLESRFRRQKYTLRTLQSRGSPNGHTNTIYCLQLYTYPDSNRQVLFTGSRDRTIREWDISTGTVIRVLKGRHDGSVLSICARNGLLASGGSDGKVVIWDLQNGHPLWILRDHVDSVLCVRFDDVRLVTCSKDRTIRTYTLPDFDAHLVLEDHRAAVNAVSIADDLIVSGSGDRSMKLWDATNGDLLQSHENHHGRGLAAIDFSPPYVLSGSSDKHMKLMDLSTGIGWCTSPEPDPEGNTDPAPILNRQPCEACGGIPPLPKAPARQPTHSDLVRSVALNNSFVISGSYDHTVKIWERDSGKLLADLKDGHTGRIFCVGFDCAKIVSCGEDQRICVWDFSDGIDTSFVKL